jgi:hypothetical protein
MGLEQSCVYRVVRVYDVKSQQGAKKRVGFLSEEERWVKWVSYIEDFLKYNTSIPHFPYRSFSTGATPYCPLSPFQLFQKKEPFAEMVWVTILELI